MSPDRATWLAARRSYLGASEVAAVCGLDPFKSPLDIWASKMGLNLGEDSEAARIGHLLEPILIEDYGRRTGRTMHSPGTLFRSDVPWAAATPDAIGTLDGDRRDVQVKVVGENMTDRWRDGSLYVVPHYTQAQAQWELWVSELQDADVVALLGGTDLQTLPVTRNDRAIGFLVEICSRFWRDYVVTRKEPPPTSKDADTLSAVFPTASSEVRDAVPEMIETIQRRHELSAAIKAAEEERALIDNTIRLAIGAAKGIRYPGGFVRWAAEGKRSNGKRVLRFMRRETP